MALVELPEFRAYLESSRSGVDNATRLQAALDAGHQSVFDYLGRVIAVASGSTTRRYSPDDDLLLDIHDATAVTVVAENGVTIAASGYQLEPLDTFNIAGTVTPYWQIRRIGSRWSTPATFGEATISVTATFGWATAPTPVVECIKMIAKDISLARELRGDVGGFGEFGVVRVRQNSQIQGMLLPYRRVAKSAYVAVI